MAARHGIWAAGASLALTAGPFVGGSADRAGRLALQSSSSICRSGLAGLWLAWRDADETARTCPTRRSDLPGQIAAIAALGSLAGAIIEGGSLGWDRCTRDRGFS